MIVRGLLMFGFVTVTTLCGNGCMQSAALPPADISRSHRSWRVPDVARINSATPYSPTTPTPGFPSANPWKPTVAARDWKYIVLHHTASSNGNVESIHETHLQRKDSDGNPWLGIGYHFVIGNGQGMGDGAIEPTFRWKQQMHGAHAGDREYNQQGIGIVLVGNFDEQPPSPAQLTAVKRLVQILRTEYNITSDRIVGHGKVKATNCPGKYFPLYEVSR